MSELKEYDVFESEDKSYTPVVTSNANIRKVCEVLTQCAFKSHQERVYYAQLGDIPAETDEEGNLVYSFSNIYANKAQATAAIAQSLFYEFPKVVTVTGRKPEVTDQGLNDKLIRSEVWKAFEDWLGKFGENPYEVTAFLNTLATNPSLTTIVETMSQLKTASSGNTNGNATLRNGFEDSSPATESGNK